MSKLNRELLERRLAAGDTESSAWTVQLDPPAILPDRTMLDLNSGPIAVGGTSSGTGIDWGSAAITAYLAQQGRYGQGQVDWDLPNRTVTIPLMLGGGFDSDNEESARGQLQQKVGLINREGGALLRQRLGGPAGYMDIVNAELTIPDVWGETGGVESDISLVLTCLPDIYGDEVQLDTLSSSKGVLYAVVSEGGPAALIAGDYPARCRIVVNETAGQDRHGLLYALRSRYADGSDPAQLVIEAETMNPINGAEVGGESWASGLATNKLAVQFTIPTAGVWTPMLETDTGEGPLTHRGTYRVRCRLNASATASVQLAWSVGTLAAPIVNDPVEVTVSGPWLIDLGVVRLTPQPVGQNAWYGVLQVKGAEGTEVDVDQFIFEPLDEAAGELIYAASAGESPSVFTTALGPAGTAASEANTITTNSPSAPSGAWGAATVDGEAGYSSSVASGTTADDWFISPLLELTNWGFDIPGDATILGIVVGGCEVTQALSGGHSHGPTLVPFVYEAVAMLLQAGEPVGANRAGAVLPSPPAGQTVASSVRFWGSERDLWGASWTPAEINSSEFGFAFAWQADANWGGLPNVVGGNVGVAPSAMTVTVYYQLEAGFAIPNDAVLYANRVAELRSDGMFRTYDGSVYGPVAKQTAGDLPRLPPSGLEGRGVELLIRPSRGEFDTEPDAGLDDFTATVYYRPCWLSRP